MAQSSRSFSRTLYFFGFPERGSEQRPNFSSSYLKYPSALIHPEIARPTTYRFTRIFSTYHPSASAFVSKQNPLVFPTNLPTYSPSWSVGVVRGPARRARDVHA